MLQITGAKKEKWYELSCYKVSHIAPPKADIFVIKHGSYADKNALKNNKSSIFLVCDDHKMSIYIN